MRTQARVDGERETKTSHKATTDSISGATTGHTKLENYTTSNHKHTIISSTSSYQFLLV